MSLDLRAPSLDSATVSGFHHRIATEADIPAIRDLMARAIAVNQQGFLTPAQIATLWGAH